MADHYSPEIKIKVKRGLKTNLPASAEDGELLVATDTGEMWIGTGIGLTQIAASESSSVSDGHVHVIPDEYGDLCPAAMIFESDDEGDMTISGAGQMDLEYEVDDQNNIIPKLGNALFVYDENDDIMPGV